MIVMSNLSQDEQDRIQIRNFNVPDSVLYPIVLKVLVDLGYPIRMQDRTTGIIQTDPILCKTSESEDIATAFLLGVVIRERNKVVANIKDGLVKLTFTFERGSRRSGMMGHEPAWEPFEPDTSFSNPYYYDTFRKIGQELNK